MPRAGLAVAFLFLVLSLPLLESPGIQNDEALFSTGVFRPYASAYSARAFGIEFPLMLMSYVGTVKSYLYKVLFAFVDPGPLTVRLPMIFAGALTVWLFFDLLRRTIGARAAWIGGLLLATDASFLFTRRYDWGPVALAHLFAAGGVWCGVRFHETGSRRWLAAACFALGLGVWDKALFFWILAGLAVATALAFPAFFRRLLAPKTLAIATVAFCLGCYPFIRYNFSKRQATFRQNVQFVIQDPPGKAAAMKATLDGTLLFGWITRYPATDPIPSLTTWLLAACIFASPFVWRRALLFGLVSFAVVWALMMFTKDTGGSVHHTILVWPLPQFLIAVVLAGLAERIRPQIPVAIAIAAISANVLVLGQFYRDLARLGGEGSWSDAIYQLAGDPAIREASTVGILDWGFDQTLHLLSRGKLPLRYIDSGNLEDQNPGPRRVLRETIEDPRATFVRHTPGNEFVPGVPESLDQLAATYGRKHSTVRIIADSHGKPMIEVFRYIIPSSAEGP